MAPRFGYLKVGDKVTRMLGGTLPMDLVVSAVDDKLIHCFLYTFSINTGAEIDDELGWTEKKTGSFLIEDKK